MRLLALLLAVLLALPAAAQTLDKIRKTGAMTLGYIDGAAPFSYADGNGEPQGYSVDLCRAVAETLELVRGLPGLKPRWVKLTIQDRIEAVRAKKVDVECSTTTWTLTRQKLVDFSLITFVDGGSLLVKSDAELARLSDLKDKRIAVIGGTTTERTLQASPLGAELVKVTTRDEGLALLREGQVVALASDRTALIGVVVMNRGGGGNYKLLDQDFSIEQYALMLPRGDHDWRLAVNRQLARVYRSGQIQDIYARWLGPLGPPSMLLSATYFIQSLNE